MIIRPQHSSLFIIKVRHFPSFVSRDSSWSKQTVAKHKPDKTQITTVTSHNHILFIPCFTVQNRSHKTKRKTQSQSFFLYVYGDMFDTCQCVTCSFKPTHSLSRIGFNVYGMHRVLAAAY
eukprot:348929_1